MSYLRIAVVVFSVACLSCTQSPPSDADISELKDILSNFRINLSGSSCKLISSSVGERDPHMRFKTWEGVCEKIINYDAAYLRVPSYSEEYSTYAFQSRSGIKMNEKIQSTIPLETKSGDMNYQLILLFGQNCTYFSLSQLQDWNAAERARKSSR